MQGRSLAQRWPYAAVLGLFLSVAGLSYLIDLPGVIERAPVPRAPDVQVETPQGPPQQDVSAAGSTEDLSSRQPAALEPLEMKAWIRHEAVSVDSVKVDEEARLKALNERLQKMTGNDWQQVAEIFLDSRAAANERVLSAYLLGRGGYDHPALVDRIFDERLASEPAPAHSPEEMSQMREKSLRLMILEEMIAAAKADPSRRAQLTQSIRRIDDPYLRKLAMRRLQEEGLE